MENGAKFMTARDVADYLGISESMAYRIIQKLNAELKARGYITISGRISRVFFEQKVYASEHEAAV